MRRRLLTTLAWSAGLVLVAMPAGAAGTAPASPPVSAAPAPATSVPAAPDWDAYHLGRAVDSWLKGDVRTAADLLAAIDVSTASAHPRADRAAFLLAVACLQLNDDAAFERVANVAGSDTGSPYRRWIRYMQVARANGRPGVPAAAPPDYPAAGIMGAALLVEQGRARDAIALLDASKPREELASIHCYLRALARESLGEDAARDWQALAGRKPGGPLEADLVGYAVLRLATRSMEDGAAAARVLERMPKGSRHAPRALHLRALLAAEAGDSAMAHTLLRDVLRDHPAYESRREVRTALGGMMMSHGYWHAALRYFESAADHWDDEFASLARLEDEASLPAVWDAWRAGSNWSGEIRLTSDALMADLERLAGESLVLARTPSLEPAGRLAAGFWPAPDPRSAAPWDSTNILLRHAPEPDEWERVRSLERREADVASEVARAEREVSDRRRELARFDRYLATGAERGAASEDTLAATAARLEAIVARLDAALLQLARVRDGALAHVAARTRDMITGLEREILFIRAIRHFHVEGPNEARPQQFPAGTPDPAELLAREEALAGEAGAFLDFFAAHYAGVIRRSFDEAWRPRLADGSRRLRGELGAELARARAIGAGIDSTRSALAQDPALAAAIERRDRLAGTLDSLRVAGAAARQEIARAVAGRARASLEAEREALDYHLSDASYEIAVQTATDSTLAEADEAVAPPRDRAIAQFEGFLERHPESAARGESRYRLADLYLMRARDEFRERMASFVGQAPSSSDLRAFAPAPLIDYGPAIAMYRAILHDEPRFAHTDAVLFNLGMILADDGQPDAMQHLSRLVTEYPKSPDVQEAWLRMGNDRFDREDFAGATPLFEHAAGGDNPSFTAMALYKLGWSYFEEDRFEDATGAFARLIDHYGRHASIARSMDLRDEAEEYLVHSLARSGGAPAFQRHFDRVGARPYEARVLTSLAQLLRGVSLYGEAAECERLWLARYPDDAGALAVAERLVDTYRRWNRPDLARETKRAEADRFLPGSAWQRAQKDAAVSTAADAFARSAYRETAAYRHAQARRSGDAATWRETLAHYEAYLEHWPAATDAPRLHYLASEAAAKVEDYPRALVHLSATITSDSLGLVLDASWQRVAVSDAWYRRSQSASAAAPKLGADSLAARVLKIGDEFTSRFSTDPRSADVAWRQGNLALAHGWYADAATRLARFGERYPSDKRALTAVARSGDARYRLGEFDRAGAAYERALPLARAAGRDSIATALETTIPTCYYQHAEGVARADSARGEGEAAALFVRVARAWPRFAHADLALYRAGLGFAARGDRDEATAAWEELLRVHPKSEYARDSAIQIALTHEQAGHAESAARAYDRFATLFPKDPDAASALLKSADLLTVAGRTADAERAKDRFIETYPDETASVMEIRAARAETELAAIATGSGSVSALAAKGSNSDLMAYLALAAKHPDLASAPILARCDYLRAEEAYAAYAAVALTQPLPKSIEKKKAKLEAVLAAYDLASQRGVTEYARASAHRIGQALVAFGDALAASERPAGLTGDDLLAYEDVIAEQSWSFHDRGEDVWAGLLRQTRHENDDPGGWVAKTREALWPRLAQRFRFQPEVHYPLVAGTPPPAPEIP